MRETGHRVVLATPRPVAVTDVLSWIAIGTFALLVATAFVRLIGWLNKTDAKAADADKKAENTALGVAAVRVELERLQSLMNQHRVEVAREYVSKDTLASLETRIVEAINRLGDRLDRMFVKTPRT